MPTPCAIFPNWRQPARSLKASKSHQCLDGKRQGVCGNPRIYQFAQDQTFHGKPAGIINPQKSVFNRIISDSHFELEFAAYLENCKDVLAYAKTTLRSISSFWIIVNRDGNISHYYPDFIVKLPKSRIVIVETKGNADLDTPLKMERLRQWCERCEQGAECG